MYLHGRLEDAELMDLLVIHTNRFTGIMIHGETYSGEYEVCKRTIENIQHEIFSRRLSPAYSDTQKKSSFIGK